MTSNHHESIIISTRLGLACDYDPAIFALARLKGNNQFVKGKLCLAATMKEVVLAYSAFHDTLDFEDFLSKIKSGFNELAEQGAGLEEQPKIWQLAKWLEHRKECKLFRHSSHDLYTVTKQASESMRARLGPKDALPVASDVSPTGSQQASDSMGTRFEFVPSKDVLPVTADDVSPTERLYGIIVPLDGDIDEKTGVRLRKTADSVDDDVSISSYYFTADENDTSNPSSMVPPPPRCTCQMNLPTPGLPSASSSATVPPTPDRPSASSSATVPPTTHPPSTNFPFPPNAPWMQGTFHGDVTIVMPILNDSRKVVGASVEGATFNDGSNNAGAIFNKLATSPNPAAAFSERSQTGA